MKNLSLLTIENLNMVLTLTFITAFFTIFVFFLFTHRNKKVAKKEKEDSENKLRIKATFLDDNESCCFESSIPVLNRMVFKFDILKIEGIKKTNSSTVSSAVAEFKTSNSFKDYYNGEKYFFVVKRNMNNHSWNEIINKIGVLLSEHLKIQCEIINV